MGWLTWRCRILTGLASLLAVSLPWQAVGDDAPAARDLGAFAAWEEGSATPAGYEAFVPADDHQPVALLPPTTSVAHEMVAPSARRFYLTSIVGGSFLVVTADNTPSSCLTAGGAMGVAVERSNGRIRLEAEGRYRDVIEQTYLGFNENFSPRDPTPVGVIQVQTAGGWSALANVWRDFRFTDQVDL